LSAAAAQDAQQEWIASVNPGNWEHTSGQGGAGYQDFSGKTDSIPVIMPLSSVSLAITPVPGEADTKSITGVFIDYNFNGVFENSRRSLPLIPDFRFRAR
jgi:hypothetical protein